MWATRLWMATRGQGFESPQVHQHFSLRTSHLQALLFGRLRVLGGHCAKDVILEIDVELLIAPIHSPPNLLHHSQLVETFGLLPYIEEASKMEKRREPSEFFS